MVEDFKNFMENEIKIDAKKQMLEYILFVLMHIFHELFEDFR